jgi:hypothetical protein
MDEQARDLIPDELRGLLRIRIEHGAFPVDDMQYKRSFL